IYDISGLNEIDHQRADGNIHLDYGASSCPVHVFQQGDFFDVRGNVWQWTETPTYPFNGFDVHPIYDDFTTPTFDGRHNLIKG
ncbi:SAM-dependent methyltransferase, partial [Escherichia coli]|nr:SAM-dependent methyltransferase [Escherichia coli]